MMDRFSAGQVKLRMDSSVVSHILEGAAAAAGGAAAGGAGGTGGAGAGAAGSAAGARGGNGRKIGRSEQRGNQAGAGTGTQDPVGRTDERGYWRASADAAKSRAGGRPTKEEAVARLRMRASGAAEDAAAGERRATIQRLLTQAEWRVNQQRHAEEQAHELV